MNLRFHTLLYPLMALALSISWIAKADPISNNPDDYDVVKYQRMYSVSVDRLNNARRLLATQASADLVES